MMMWQNFVPGVDSLSLTVNFEPVFIIKVLIF